MNATDVFFISLPVSLYKSWIAPTIATLPAVQVKINSSPEKNMLGGWFWKMRFARMERREHSFLEIGNKKGS